MLSNNKLKKYIIESLLCDEFIDINLTLVNIYINDTTIPYLA
jgi:hypothetical protein